MTPRRNDLALRTSVLAVRSALAAFAALSLVPAARAADASLADLTSPTNTIELGVTAPDKFSAKAAEYDGMRSKGPFGVLNLDLRGGSPYDADDTLRWRLAGTNLGLEDRRLGAELGEQGRYRLDFGYSELLRNRSDSFQTPYLGAGTGTLTLPANWLVPLVPRVSATSPNARGLSPDVSSSSAIVSGVLTAPTDAQLAQSAAIQAADVPAFQKVTLSTKRAAYNVGVKVNLARDWLLDIGFKHEDRTGLKPMSTITAYTGGDIAAVIPDVINQQTEQYNALLTYAGEKLVLSGGYHASVFHNLVPSMSWENWASADRNLQTMSSAPNNFYQQLALNGHYAFTRDTRMSGQVTLGRASQNDAFLTDSTTPLVPVASLDGLVLTRTGALKVVTRATPDLTFTAAYKHDDRENRTPVNTYGFSDAGAVIGGTSPFQAYFPGVTLGSNVNLNANRPYDKRLNRVDFDADWRVAPGQALAAGAGFQKIDYDCHDTWIACADASRTRETSLHGEWRFTAIENVEARLGLSTAHRHVQYNEDAFLALVPMANLAPAGAPGGATAYGTLLALGFNGYGPISGLNPLPTAGSAQAFFFPNNNVLANALYGNVNRISELPGMRRYNLADRNRNALRGSVNWQASEKLSLQAGLDLNDDAYDHSVYGLRSARGTALNLDATYSASEALSLSAFATLENMRQVIDGNSYNANSTATSVNGFTDIANGCYGTIADRNSNYKTDACLDWRSNTRDKVHTLGLTAHHKGLAGGKLDLSGTASFSQARTDIGVTGGNYANNPYAVAGAPAGTVAAYYIGAAPLPTITTDILDLRVNARYAVTASQQVGLGLQWQHLKNVDWAYDGRQFGSLSGVLPTLETAPDYSITTFALTYSVSFR